VIPVRDGAAFLPTAVGSVRDQVGPRVELIVVDDGSTDGSAELARALDVDRVVSLPGNAGVSTARNVGLALSSGELVCFHDVDDEMLPGKLQAQLRHLERVPGDGGVMVDQLVALAPGVAPPPWLAANPSAYAGSALLRTAAVVLCGGFDPALRIGEDVDLWRRMRAAGTPVGRLAVAYVRRNVHGGNVTYGLDPADGWLQLARAAAGERRRPATTVALVAPRRSALWSAAVARNLAVLHTRSPVLVFDPALGAAAADLLRARPSVDVVWSGQGDAPPAAVRRAALARVGLWRDVPDSCERWWAAARAIDLVVGTLADAGRTR
jgi:hypothetical protein